MIELGVGRVGSLVRIMALAGILLLTAVIGASPWADRDQSVSGHLTAPVTCILPVTTDVPSPTPASASDATRLDCEESTPYGRAVWIAC